MVNKWSFDTVDVKTVLIGVVVFVTVNWYCRRPAQLPPGPRSWPLLGCLPSLLFYSGGAAHDIFLRLSQKYGPIVTIELVAGQRVVVLHGYDVIREAFHHPDLNGRPSLPVFERVLKGGIGVVGSSGDLCKAQRRITLNFMRDFGLGKPLFEDRIIAEVRFMLDEFRTYNGRPFNLSQTLSKAVANVICLVVFGSRYESTDPKFVGLLHALYRNMELMGGASGAVLFMPHSHLLARFIPIVKECLDNMQFMCDFTRDVLEDHLQDFDSAHLRDFIDVIIKETSKTNGKSRVTVHDMYGTTADLFVAGTETIAFTLQWGFLYMMAYPEIQRKIQVELDLVVGRSRLPRFSDRLRLPYTEATLLEVQRIGTVIPLGVPHQATRDVTLRGYHIPQGTVVLPNLRALGTDPKLWPMPDSFRPERFLDDTGQRVIPRDESIPFCIGRRSCIGEQLAKMELFIFFTHFLHQFTITKPEGSPPISFQGVGGVSLAPLPFEISAVPRIRAVDPI